MEEIENIKNELNEIKTARDDIKTALENEGETVTNDIRTYADTIPNVNKVKTVNSVEADENKNVQLDASKINLDDTAETKQTIKESLEELDNKIKEISIFQWDGKSSDDNTSNIDLWQNIIDEAKTKNVMVIYNSTATVLGMRTPIILSPATTIVDGENTFYSCAIGSVEEAGAGNGCSYKFRKGYVKIFIEGNTVINVSKSGALFETMFPYLTTQNNIPEWLNNFTPSHNMHPATKKYVDDKVGDLIVPDYSVIETTVTEGYSKTYSLTKDGTEVGVKINIPKDLVVNKGNVKVVATAGTPYEGAVVGDKYLDIELNDPTKDHIYIPVKELVDVYTAGDGIEISTDNVIKSKNSNLINGSRAGSLRSINSAPETSTYELGNTATALGNDTKAGGHNSLAEGSFTESSGPSSHAEGSWTKSNGSSSHAEGTNTIASCNNSHVQGRYNIEDTNEKYAHIVGNGDESNRSNAHTVAWDGTGWFQGNVKVGGTGQDDTNAKNLATEDYVNNELEPVKTDICLIQNTVGGIFYWDGKSSSDNPDNIQLWNNILTKHLEQDVLIYTTILSNYTDTGVITLSKGKLNLSTDGNKTLDIGFVGTKQFRNMSNTDISTKACRITLTITNGKVTNINSLNSISNGLGQYLETNYNYSTPYTPKYGGSPATKKYVDDKYNTLSVVEIVSADKEPGYTFSFGKLCDSVMVFLNGEKLIAQKSSSQTIGEYSYIENKTDNKITSVTFTNDFTITTGDRIEAILINPSDISTAGEISESSDE